MIMKTRNSRVSLFKFSLIMITGGISLGLRFPRTEKMLGYQITFNLEELKEGYWGLPRSSKEKDNE